MTSVETPFVIADAMPLISLFVAGATSVPLLVTCGDISPRRGENLSRPGEVFLKEGGFAARTVSLFEGAVAAGDWGSLLLNAKKPRGAGCSSGQVNSSILRIKLYDTDWTISIAIAA